MNVKAKAKSVIAWLAERRLLGVSIVGTSIVLGAVIIATGPHATPEPLKEKAWPVSVVKADPSALAPTLNVYGKVESRHMATLKTSVSAPVDAVLTPEGTWVDKGEVMIRLDKTELALSVRSADSDYKRRLAVLASAKNDFASAKKMMSHYKALKEIAGAKLERNKALFKKKMISDAILDEARQIADQSAITFEEHVSKLANYPSIIDQDEAMVAEGKAILEKAKLDLAQAEIRAPFSGRVIATMVAPGDRIQPGVPLIQVADYSELEVRAPIPADTGYALRERMHEGAEVSAVASVDGQTIDFVLNRLSGDVKSGQSGLDAFFSARGKTGLDIGRVVGLKVTLPVENDVVALPVQALYEGNRVYKVVDDRLVALDVDQVGDYTDANSNYRILVRSPKIKAGDKLITTQLPRAISGLLVEPIDASKFDQAIASGPGKDTDGS